jgi:hypothetical protein
MKAHHSLGDDFPARPHRSLGEARDASGAGDTEAAQKRRKGVEWLAHAFAFLGVTEDAVLIEGSVGLIGIVLSATRVALWVIALPAPRRPEGEGAKIWAPRPGMRATAPGRARRGRVPTPRSVRMPPERGWRHSNRGSTTRPPTGETDALKERRAPQPVRCRRALVKASDGETRAALVAHRHSTALSH